MEDNKNLYPPLPSNYITIVDLQNRWLQQKQQQQQQEEDKEEQIQKHEHNHNLSNKFVQNQEVKPNAQFQKFNRSNSYVSPNSKPRSSFYGKKQAEEFQVVKKASNSSEINGNAAKKDGYCEEKRSRFRKTNCSNFDRNPNFGNRKPFYRNVNDEKRLKEFQAVRKVRNAFPEESKINVDVNSIEIDDQKVEDEKKTMKKRNYRNKKRNRKVVDECRKDEERENEGKLIDDQTVEEKDDHVIAEYQTVENQDDQVILEDQTVEKKDEQVIVEDRTVEKKDEKVIVEDRTVEEIDDQVIDEDRTVEIDQKLKELSVSGLMDGRSTAVIEGRRREYGGYGRGYRRGYYNGRKNWGSRRGGFVAVDGFFGRGRSTVEDEGWRGVHRGYSRGENRRRGLRGKGEFMWVKKE